MTDRTIKRLEKEIVALQDEQTALLRKKYMLEDEIRKHNKRIKELENKGMEAEHGKKTWQKLTAFILAVWVVFLSLFGVDRK